MMLEIEAGYMHLTRPAESIFKIGPSGIKLEPWKNLVWLFVAVQLNGRH